MCLAHKRNHILFLLVFLSVNITTFHFSSPFSKCNMKKKNTLCIIKDDFVIENLKLCMHLNKSIFKSDLLTAIPYSLLFFYFAKLP